MVAAAVFMILNLVLVSTFLALRTGQVAREVFVGDLRGIAGSVVALAPLAWLMAVIYGVQWWATALFAVPLYSTRLAYQRFVEMRDMFTQTIGALAEAVDKRDPYTARHSHRVKEIAVDIGRVMRVSDAELEALEWGGLLHDVGKIGVPDNVLLKQERLNKEERMMMNAHPVLGAQIIAPVTKLAPELPIIRHHHEWYNGSGYPDRLIGDEIPQAGPRPPRGRRVRGHDGRPPVPHDAAHQRAGARRAAQVRRRSSSTRSSSMPSSRRTTWTACPDPGACPSRARSR